MDMCLLIPILVGLICALLGYLLGKLLGGGSDSSTNIDVYKNRISKLEADLAACRASTKSNYNSGNSPTSAVSSFASGAVTEVAATTFDKAEAKAAFGKNIKQDDLTVVEGIGPKIKELFHNHDVKTWAALAGCTVDKCQDVLNSGGKRFEIHKPGTWPEQAKLAAQGKWLELKKWQDELDGGR